MSYIQYIRAKSIYEGEQNPEFDLRLKLDNCKGSDFQNSTGIEKQKPDCQTTVRLLLLVQV